MVQIENSLVSTWPIITPFFYVKAMCKRCTRNGQAVRCNLKRGNDVSKWHEKYNFSCRSNINKFDTNQLLPKEKRTSLEQQIRW